MDGCNDGCMGGLVDRALAQPGAPAPTAPPRLRLQSLFGRRVGHVDGAAVLHDAIDSKPKAPCSFVVYRYIP